MLYKVETEDGDLYLVEADGFWAAAKKVKRLLSGATVDGIEYYQADILRESDEDDDEL